MCGLVCPGKHSRLKQPSPCLFVTVQRLRPRKSCARALFLNTSGPRGIILVTAAEGISNPPTRDEGFKISWRPLLRASSTSYEVIWLWMSRHRMSNLKRWQSFGDVTEGILNGFGNVIVQRQAVTPEKPQVIGTVTGEQITLIAATVFSQDFVPRSRDQRTAASAILQLASHHRLNVRKTDNCTPDQSREEA